MAETNPVDRLALHPALGGIPLVLGGNVFGWTIDRDRSFAVLDAFFEAGGRMIDTAEGYSDWVPGNQGGESEAIIGAWMESRGVRAAMRIGTKTGQGGGPNVLRPEKVRQALEGSLERLRTDYVDLYYAHRDDLTTPLDEVVSVYNEAFRTGRARELGASNYSAERLSGIRAVARKAGAQPFTVIQPHYNLVARSQFEGALQDMAVRDDIAVMPYYGLAAGFLTGKYNSPEDWAGSGRSGGLDRAVTDGAWAKLDALRRVAAQLGATPAQLALAWLRTRPGVAAPIASATTPEQVRELAGAARLDLPVDVCDILE
ncbi:aldo/keto reductase [Novosphingobium soli]|uniref:Aldo/keto reductase n=1 Tax=Novosphingobium soli TaxID=574956 RepID=A0ABV6CRL7_9SPHN